MSTKAKNVVHSRKGETQDAGSKIIELTKQLISELQPYFPLKQINLDSSLDRELGLDSLARVELISRIETYFDVALPEQTFSMAEVLRDLLRAVESAHADTTAIKTATVAQRKSTVNIPTQAQTLIDVLHWHADKHPHRKLIQMYEDMEEGETMTYSELLTGARSVAAGLQSHGIRSGDTVVLMLNAGRDYFFSFFAVLLTGAIPVPIYPPARPSQIEDHIIRHTRILQNCATTMLITTPEAKHVAQLLKARVESLKSIVTVEDLMKDESSLTVPEIKPNDIAFLQYTSGSTGDPKGVILTHSNLLENIRAMGERVEATSKDVFVSWLPLYHDMGLIGAWFGSLYFGMLFVVMSPLAFLTRPQRWLWAINRYRGTLSASPNFGYEYCLKKINEDDLKGLDLSSWRAAFNGAEAVSPDTVRKFCDRFKEYGFHKNAYMPVYGLAENSVGLTFPKPGQGPRVDTIQRELFSTNGLATPVSSEDQNSICFMSCGIPIPHHQIRVVDTANNELPERQEGELQFCGPSATSGYYRNPDAVKQLFSGDWLNTGDLAYIADGELYVTGRVKDIIIRAGRNLYPQELEEAVGNIDGIRKGRVAVFSSRNHEDNTEKLVVMAETREVDPGNRQQLVKSINLLANDLIGATVDDVVLAPQGTILKTSSGKIRRAACRELYENKLIGKKPKTLAWQFIHLLLTSIKPQLKRVRRTFITFVYGFYGLALFYSIAALAWLLVAILPTMNQRWFVMRIGTKLLAKLTATPLIIKGQENLPAPQQACVFVANHTSYLDGPILIALLNQKFSFVAKIELLNNFISRIFLQRIGSSFVERFDTEKSIQDTKSLQKLAESGQSLLFFSEGTFTRIPGLRPFHMGAFMIAAKTRLPVVPVTIRGCRSILRGGTRMPQRGAITVTISEPVYPTLQDTGNDLWETAIDLQRRTRESMLKTCGEPDLERV